MLIIDHITSARGGRILFSDMSFCALPGSFVQLRGQNGSGKTTLLEILAKIRKPDNGRIELEQETKTQTSTLYIAHRNAIKEELTVLENIGFWAALHGTEMLVPAALHYWGLTPFADILCAQLSPGWKRRIALARLVAIPSSFWLLDEPESHLDAQGVGLLYQLIAARCNQGGIVVMATHAEIKIQPVIILQLEDFLSNKEEI